MKRTYRVFPVYIILISLLMLSGCQRPKEDIVLRNIRDVVMDASSEPTLKANAIFYNPNNVRGRLKKIDVEIFVNGKKSSFSQPGPKNGDSGGCRVYRSP